MSQSYDPSQDAPPPQPSGPPGATPNPYPGAGAPPSAGGYPPSQPDYTPPPPGYAPPPPGYAPPPPGYAPPPPGYSSPPPGYAPPPYGYGAPMPPPAPPSRWGPTSLGMEPHVAAGLSYLSMFFLGPIVPLVFFFVEKTNRFVKFHAAQGILIAIVGFVVALGLGIIAAILTALAFATQGSGFIAVFFVLLYLLDVVVGLGIVGLVIWGTIAAFSNQYVKMPIIGDMAEKWAGGPAVPAF